MTGKRRARCGLLALSLLVATVIVGATSSGSSDAASKAVALDVEIAIDTTGSMGSSISQAQADAKGLVKDIRARFSGAMFATVQFRDSYDTPEYQVMQTMTGDPTAIDTSIDGLRAGGGGDYPEAHNLVFQNALDTTVSPIGWRAGSRKILVVISDAEPHGAGTAGYKGCTDTSADPHALSTSTVLANLKAAGVTVLMVRQASGSATLECYKSLSSAGYTGGAARNGGDKLADVIEAMIVRVVGGNSPLGLWKLGSYKYRWVARVGGYEERAMTAHRLRNRCLVRRGDGVVRYRAKGNNVYKLTYRYWHARSGGAGPRGLNCTKYWRAANARVRVLPAAATMTVSCENKLNKVCYRYKRIG